MQTLMRRVLRLAALPLVAIFAFFTAADRLLAADDKPQPDVIIFTNGDLQKNKACTVGQRPSKMDVCRSHASKPLTISTPTT